MVTNRFDLMRALGPALAALRKQSGKTARQVAREIGRSNTGVSRYECGQREISIEILFKYLAAVGASLGDLDEAIQQQVGSGT